MTEPQVWTLIGVFAAGMFGTLTLMSTMFLRTMQNGFEGVRIEMRNEFASVRTESGSEFAGVRTEIRAMHASIISIAMSARSTATSSVSTAADRRGALRGSAQAISSSAITIFFMCMSAWICSGRCCRRSSPAGTTCQLTPKRSLHQPHASASGTADSAFQ